MRTQRGLILTLCTVLIAAAGCATYRFHSKVPEELRTVAVPVFENASGYPELDAIVTQYVLREFQREGTFKIRRIDTASLKLLGKLVHSEFTPLAYDRNYGTRASEYRYTVTVEITLVERSTGKLLIDGQTIKADTTFITHGDIATGMTDSYPRIAKQLSREIVDAVLAHW